MYSRIYPLLLICSFPVLAEEPYLHTAPNNEAIHHINLVMTLNQAIENALDVSPRLQSFQAQINSAKGVEKQSHYWLNPLFAFEVENFAGNGDYTGTNFAEFTYSLAQTFEIGGKRLARQKASRSAVETSKIEFIREKINLISDVEIAYLAVLAANEALKISSDQQKLSKEIFDNVVTRVEAAREPDIQQHKAAVALSISNIKNEQNILQLQLAKKNLALYWNAVNLESALDQELFFNLKPPKNQEYYKSCLRQTPEIAKYISLRNEKISNLSFEKAQAIPDPTINAGYRRLNETSNNAFILSVTLPIPIFNRNQGNISRAIAAITEIDSRKLQSERELELYINENWYNWQTAYREATELKANILPTAQKAFSLARAAYQTGKYSYIEVLDAQRTLSDVNSQYYDALKRYHTSRIALERLTAIIE